MDACAIIQTDFCNHMEPGAGEGEGTSMLSCIVTVMFISFWS